MTSHLVYILFALSGFSALVYELLFTYYLKLFLGHSAYSQALVLSVFMGGLTIGSILTGYFVDRIKKTAILYFWVELGIGVYGIFFDIVFKKFVNISHNFVIPHIESLILIDLYRMVSSALLILPQVILLGATFPLISSFLIRRDEKRSGEILSILYFSNTIGGSLGIFFSGFFLLDYFGLSQTIYFAGFINILLAIIFRAYVIHDEKSQKKILYPKNEYRTGILNRENYFFMLFVAFLTGLSSFIYEIAWIRMLSLVFGSSINTFEIMLFSFLLGLSFGGYFIRNRIDRLGDDISCLANVQILMGLFAISTLPLYNISFDIFSYFFNVLPKDDLGYHLYNFLTQVISIGIMFPATFFAGMTLPLITNHLVKNNYGESSIGYVYGANTIGAIIGIILTIHVLFPVTGLKDSLLIGAIIDILIGIELIIKYRVKKEKGFSRKYIAFSVILIVLILGYFFNPKPLKLVSGVYRTGEIIEPDSSTLLFYKEGKTASISVVKIDNALSIRTNGKSDSAISVDPLYPPEMDEYTIFLLGYLPLLYHPTAKNAANIGLGTGVTSHILLSNKNLLTVDTIEIEREVLKASRFFSPYNKLIFSDKRSRIFIDDARNFFVRNKKKYDIIVSEPSNPWISGVASLFTKEFYKIIANSLNDNGIFVQWLQMYEIDTSLMSSVFKALSPNFSDYLVYATTDNEVLIVAKKKGALTCPSEMFINHEITYFLNRLGIFSLQDIEIRKIGTKKTLDKFFQKIPIAGNSDYEPLLERRAPKTRFLNVGAGSFLKIANYHIPLLNILEGERYLKFENTELTPSPYYTRAKEAYIAMGIRDMILKNKVREGLPKDVVDDINRLLFFLKNPESLPGRSMRMNLLFGLGISTIPYLNEKELLAIWNMIENSHAYRDLDEIGRLWIELFKSISKRDIVKMKEVSEKIYLLDKTAPPLAREYLITIIFLSSSLIGDDKNLSINRAETIELFKENKIVFEFLEGVCK